MSARRASRLTPEQRKTQARLAALARWARTEDRTAATQAARDAMQAKFDAMPHPETAKREHMTRLALASSRARSRSA